MVILVRNLFVTENRKVNYVHFKTYHLSPANYITASQKFLKQCATVSKLKFFTTVRGDKNLNASMEGFGYCLIVTSPGTELKLPVAWTPSIVQMGYSTK